MLKLKIKLFISVLTTTSIIGSGFFALPVTASAKQGENKQASHNYVIQLKSADAKILKAIPGLTNIEPVFAKSEHIGLTNIYTFSSTATLETLRFTFEGFYEYLDSNEIIDQSPIEAAAKVKKVIPNDPAFTQNELNIDKQWGLAKANFISAWETTQGKRSTVVAVIDTGIDGTHEDFEHTKFVTGYNTITKKTIPGGSNSDDNGHGTLVAGVIAASTDNDTGISGAASGVALMPLKALNASGTGSSTKISEAIVWATDHNADVINLSLGGIGFGHDTVLANAITYAFNNDVLIIAAAGNDVAITGGNLDKDPVFPICDDNGQNMIIGVTATDHNDLKPSFANYGKACVDVSAPGKRILSTINHDPSTGRSAPDSYAYASGTSLAVPYVSAQAGLLRSVFPKATNKQIRDRIISTADNVDNLNLSQCADHSCKGYLGSGRINAAKSLETKFADIKDGDVVQVTGTSDFYYINGSKRQQISPFVKNQRFANSKIKTVPFSDVQNFPEGSYAEPLDGTLVKSPNESTVYYIQTGLRRPLTAQVFTMRGFQFSEIVTLTNVEVGSWIEGSFLAPPDGTVLRGKNNPTIYWTVNGIIHPVNYEFFINRGLNTLPLAIIPDSDIAKFPHGDPYIL